MIDLDLNSSYKRELDKFIKKEIIDINDIKNSIAIFEDQSLLDSFPIPKRLEVIAIVSGIPFDKVFQKKIIAIQSIISKSLFDTLHYLVKPKNLAVEYLVLKWPSDNLPENAIKSAKDFLKNTRLRKFKFKIYGVQMHKDGCILLQGISEDMILHKIREKMMMAIPNLPKKQSNWAHIPLGRFLEPLNASKKKKINELIFNLNKNFKTFSTNINNLHLINEHRWYMEEVSKIYTKNLV
tara:strand:+ start:275 stop:988 length:714 start_codon:yes stop_codon:yes gene_type:complete